MREVLLELQLTRMTAVWVYVRTDGRFRIRWSPLFESGEPWHLWSTARRRYAQQPVWDKQVPLIDAAFAALKEEADAQHAVTTD